VIVGKNLADGVIELRDRRTDERTDVPVADAVDAIAAAVRS
jgi:prolyl-tRNA synthetase